MNKGTVEQLPLVALTQPHGVCPFTEWQLLQGMPGNDAVVMKILEVG